MILTNYNMLVGIVDTVKGWKITKLSEFDSLPFIVVASVAFASLAIPTQYPPDWQVVSLAVGWMACVVALELGTPWARLPSLLRPLPAICFFGVIVLLRHSTGGASSGFGVLVLLPVVWVALHRSQRVLVVAVVVMALMFVAPIILFGGPEYPDSEWRRALLFVVIVGGVGELVRKLVTTIRTEAANNAEAALVDALTGVPNRRAFDASLIVSIAQARRSNEPVCVALIDLDYFKRYNDVYGHPAGDALLAEAAGWWAAEIRDGDILARYGGEEFALIFNGSDVAQAEVVLKRILANVPSGQTCSAGLARWDGVEDIGGLVQRADELLYRAKSGGRNRYCRSADIGWPDGSGNATVVE